MLWPSLLVSMPSSVAILISGGVGATIAVLSIKSAREIARKKNAIDLVISAKQDDYQRESIKVIRDYHEDAHKDIVSLAHKSSDDNVVKAQKHLRYILNYFEYISVGVRNKIYDEKIIKDSMFGTISKTYTQCKPYILKARELSSSNTIYQEFEALAQRWAKPRNRLQALCDKNGWKLWLS